MAVAIADLVKDLTKEEVLDALLALAKAAGVEVTAWQSGEPMLALLEKLSEWFATMWNNVIVKAIRAGFLEYAEGDWLTLLAWVAYGVIRRTATFAGGTITLENRAGGLWVFAPGDVRISNGSDKTFTNVTGGTLAAWIGSGDYPTVDLDFVADEAGSGSNTPTSGIRAYPTPPVAAPASVYAVTNADPLFADDTESDTSLRERCRLSTGPLSPAGPVAAFESIARGAVRADGTSVDVTRVRVLEPGACTVNVYLAGANGAASGDAVTAGTDVYIVNQQLQVLANAAGITCIVAAAEEVFVAATIELLVARASNLSAASAVALATDAVEAYFRELQIGGHRETDGGQGYVFASELTAKASEAHAGIIRATINIGDVALDADQVAVPSLTVNATIVTQ